MVIGLAHGKATLRDDAAKERTYALTREFWRRFRERQGSLVCRELLGVNIGTPEGAKAAVESGVIERSASSPSARLNSPSPPAAPRALPRSS